MSQPARSPFVESQLGAALPAAGPEWLQESRREHLQRFAANGLPDARSELWKYTALRALNQRRFAVGDESAATRAIDLDALRLPALDGPRLVFVDGVFRADLSRLDALPDGLALQPLSVALEDPSAPLPPALAHAYSGQGDGFAQLNAALARDGAVLRLRAGVRVVEPVHLLFIGAPADAELAWHVRNAIELGEGAELTLFEQHASAGANANLGTVFSEVALRAGARLHGVTLQDVATGSTLIRRVQLNLEARARASLHALELGGALARHDLCAWLEGDEAHLDTRGVFVARGRQHLDTQLAIHHGALRTRSSSSWRGVADGRGHGVFGGAIVVAPGADGADAALDNKNLLLSAAAEIDTKPVLEIYADEVQAAHGATVGQLDERALFYLRSRGIPQAEARTLLTAAFCRAVLSDLPNAVLREHLTALLAIELPS